VCDDDHQSPDHALGILDGLSRRHVLQGMVALAALAGTGSIRSAAAAPLRARAANAEGLTPYVLGMHLHASASEGQGSVHRRMVRLRGTRGKAHRNQVGGAQDHCDRLPDFRLEGHDASSGSSAPAQ